MELLEQKWKDLGRPYTRVKYPIYESPSGVLINLELRGKKEDKLGLSDEELQELFAYNRRDYEPTLRQLLSIGDVFGEDYVGTGKAWGLTFGVKREKLDEFNKGLLVPDISLCLDGERFSCGIEKEHRHEAAGDGVWERNRRVHQELALEYGWEVIDANRSKERVHQAIFEAVLRRW
jgi:thymidylate kinase